MGVCFVIIHYIVYMSVVYAFLYVILQKCFKCFFLISIDFEMLKHPPK